MGSHTVSALTVKAVDDRGLCDEIEAVFGYRRNDPFAVTMTFRTDDGDVVWTFGRDLLSQGIHSPTGDGDVHVCPAASSAGRSMVSIELCSPDGQLSLLARSSEIEHFLTNTAAIVAPGAESNHINVDVLIAQVLAS